MISRPLAWARSLWRGLRRRSDVEAEIDEEFRLHIEMRAEDLIRAGLTPAEATRRARIEFGSTERYKDEGRASRWLRPFDEIGFSLLDIRLGIRMMIKYPGLTIVGIMALAFAIFAGSVGFEITKRAVFPKISLADPDRIVTIDYRDAESNQLSSASIADFVGWRDEVRSIEALGAFRLAHRNLLSQEGRGEPVMLVDITPSAFGLMGVRPLLGRAMVESDERPDAPAVIVIRYDVWRDLGSDPSLVGRTVQVGTEMRTVVGVMPADLSFPEQAFNAWIPLRITAQDEQVSGGSPIRLFGRLAPDATIDQAQAELTVLGRRATASLRPEVRRLRSVVWRNEGQPASILSLNVALGMLLILVCGNVALLIFARAATREGEITVRTALGAGRRRIMMQLVAESLVLAAASAAMGLLAAELVLRWNLGFPPIGFMDKSGLTFQTVLYAGLLTAAAAGILGVLPALKVTRGLAGRLRQVGPGGGGFRFGGLWTAVVIAQVAFTVALPSVLFGMRAEIQATRAVISDAGIPTHEYLIFMLEMDNEAEPGLRDIPADSARATDFRARFGAAYEELERRLEAESRVRSVTFASQLPTRPHVVRRINLDEGGAPAASQADLSVSTASVSLDFFEAMDAPILAGRGFSSSDVESGAPVIVVNQSFVERILGGTNPIGRRIQYVNQGLGPDDRRSGPQDERWYEIVGVVPDRAMGRGGSRTESPWFVGVYHVVAPGAIYPPLVAVRVTGDPASMVPRIKALAAAVSPTLRLDDPERIPGLTVVSLDESNYWLLRGPTLLFSLSTLLGAVAVVLSLAGIYAITSFTAGQRTREIGLRVALGAGASRIIAVIFRRPFVQVGTGILIGGILVATLMSKGFSTASARGAVLLVAYALLMMGVFMLAAIVPIRRTLRVEPSVALRAEL